MRQHPPDLCAPHGADGLPLAHPGQNAPRMRRGRRLPRIRTARGGILDAESAVGAQQADAGAGGGPGGLVVVEAHVARLHERGLDAQAVDLVEHGLDEALDGVFGGAEGAEAGDAEGAGRGAEDEIAAAGGRAVPEVGERVLDYVQRAEEVGVELGAEFVLGLVFAGADYAFESGREGKVRGGEDGKRRAYRSRCICRRIGISCTAMLRSRAGPNRGHEGDVVDTHSHSNHINSPPMPHTIRNHVFHRFSYPHIAHGRQSPPLAHPTQPHPHLLDLILPRPPHRRDPVIVHDGSPHQTPSEMSRRAEDLVVATGNTTISPLLMLQVIRTQEEKLSALARSRGAIGSSSNGESEYRDIGIGRDIRSRLSCAADCARWAGRRSRGV